MTLNLFMQLKNGILYFFLNQCIAQSCMSIIVFCQTFFRAIIRHITWITMVYIHIRTPVFDTGSKNTSSVPDVRVMVPPIDGIREIIRIGPEKVIIRQVSIIFGTDGTNDQIGRHTPFLIHANQTESSGKPILQGN